MNIGIDIRCLSEGRRTGVEEYTVNLLKNIFDVDKKNNYILFVNSFRKAEIDISWIKKYSNVKIKRFYIPNKILNLFFWYLTFPKIDKILGGVDILFVPNINFIAVSKKVKLILTIHDLSFEYFPETFSFKRRLWHFLVNPRKLAKRANKIIAVSQSTKKDIEQIYSIPDYKIKKIYNGISDDFKIMDRNDLNFLRVKEKYNLPFNFILFLGTFEPRKNIVGIINAYEKLRDEKNKKLDKYKLVIAGSGGWKIKNIINAIKKSKYHKDIILTGYIDDNDKVYIYNLATVFIYPSFFEGFGMPPLEAMKCGTSVIVANNSSLSEVVGSGGVMVDSDRTDEIAMACKEVILNKNFRENICKKGIVWAQKFSWKKTAREFLNIVKEIK